MPNVPYRTSKGVEIGKYYEKPKYIEYDTDMLLIQSYLIYDPEILRKQYWFKKLYICFVVILLGYLILIT